MAGKVADYMKWHRKCVAERKSTFPRQHAIQVAEYEKTKLWEQMTNEERKLVWQLEEGPT